MADAPVDLAVTLPGAVTPAGGAGWRTTERPDGAASGPADDADLLARGDLVDRYVVLGRVGRGGMGVVYAAYDPDLDRKVALKLLLPHRADGAAAGDRLRREGQAMARLAHPNVVAVYDVGAIHGRLWIAMEFVRGDSLAAWLADVRPRRRAIVDVFLAAGEGLRAAHDAGLVHRDFKPDNVMLGADGRARVMDFGLARRDPSAAGDAPGDRVELGGVTALRAVLTQDGAIVGTPQYMSPEQWQGQPADARSDQFAFCVALWEALYGEPPFPGATIDALVLAVLRGQPRAPRHARVPRWLREALARGLRVDPAARWPTMAALLERLRRGQARGVGGRVALGVAAAALVVVALIAGQSLERAQRRAHAALQDGLRATRAGAAEVVSDVLRARAGLLTDYDPIVQATRRLERAHAELAVGLAGLTGPHVADIAAALAERRGAAARTRDELELFKARLAVLRNSSHYFPVLVARTTAVVPGLDEPLVTVLRELLRLDMAAPPELSAEIRARITDLAATPVEPGRRADLERLCRHAEIVLDHRVVVDRTVAAVSALQADANYEALAAAIRANDDATAGLDEGLRRGLLLAALVALVAAAVRLAPALRARRARRGEDMASRTGQPGGVTGTLSPGGGVAGAGGGDAGAGGGADGAAGGGA